MFDGVTADQRLMLVCVSATFQAHRDQFTRLNSCRVGKVMLGAVVQHYAVERNGRVQGNGRVEDSGTGSETQVPDGTRDEPGAVYAMQYATVRDTFAVQKTQRESRQDRAGGRPRRLVECRERVDLTYDEPVVVLPCL